MDPIGILTLCVAIVATLATGYAYFRSSAVKVWEQNTIAYRARVELLEKQNLQLEGQVKLLVARVAELEARPDWDRVVKANTAMEYNIISEVRRALEEVIDAGSA